MNKLLERTTFIYQLNTMIHRNMVTLHKEICMKEKRRRKNPNISECSDEINSSFQNDKFFSNCTISHLYITENVLRELSFT